jgi:apolipoprotein N-acyltransferase
MNRLRPYIPSVLSAVLLALAFPPVGLGFLAYVGLIPLLPAVGSLRLREVFIRFFLAGLIFFGATVFWMKYVTWVGMVIAVCALAALYTVPFVAAGFVRTRFPRGWLFALPFFVAGFEWVRSFGSLAFPWMIFGNSQTSYPMLIQFADITSAFGVSAWVVMVNVSLYLLLRRRTLARFVFPVLLFLAPLGYSMHVIRSAPKGEKAITVALVQGNIPQDEKWGGDVDATMELYFSMTRNAASSHPDLVVWSETAIPVYVLQEPYYLFRMQSFVDSLGIPVFSGIPAIDLETDVPYRDRKTWNSSGLFLPGVKEVQRYDKIHLVPFGEAFPLDNVFPALRGIDLGQANWEEGKETVVFTSPQLPPFHAAICFESIFPDLNRKFIRKGSEFIVVITNDAWFGPRTAPFQHAMIAVMRAIEFHRPVARCANTGISEIVDPWGRIVSRTATFERTTLIGTIAPRRGMTFYARFGNLFSMGSFILLMTLVVSTFVSDGGSPAAAPCGEPGRVPESPGETGDGFTVSGEPAPSRGEDRAT